MALAGCDPAARTTLRITPSLARDLRAGATLTVTSSDVEAVVGIVESVALEHGLARESWERPEEVAVFHRRWDFAGDGHARTISLSVFEDEGEPATTLVVVDEWLSFGHSALGQEILDDLRARLRDAFGAEAVTECRD